MLEMLKDAVLTFCCPSQLYAMLVILNFYQRRHVNMKWLIDAYIYINFNVSKLNLYIFRYQRDQKFMETIKGKHGKVVESVPTLRGIFKIKFYVRSLLIRFVTYLY